MDFVVFMLLTFSRSEEGEVRGGHLWGVPLVKKTPLITVSCLESRNITRLVCSPGRITAPSKVDDICFSPRYPLNLLINLPTTRDKSLMFFVLLAEFRKNYWGHCFDENTYCQAMIGTVQFFPHFKKPLLRQCDFFCLSLLICYLF